MDEVVRVRGEAREADECQGLFHAGKVYELCFSKLLNHAVAGLRSSYGAAAYPDTVVARRLACGFIQANSGSFDVRLIDRIELKVTGLIEQGLKKFQIPTEFPSEKMEGGKQAVLRLNYWMVATHKIHAKEERSLR